MVANVYKRKRCILNFATVSRLLFLHTKGSKEDENNYIFIVIKRRVLKSRRKAGSEDKATLLLIAFTFYVLPHSTNTFS